MTWEIHNAIRLVQIREIVGRGGVWEKNSTSDNAAHIAVLFPLRHPDAGASAVPVTVAHEPPRCGCGCAVGSGVNVFGAPYGAFESHVFFNVVSDGIVSNKLRRVDRGAPAVLPTAGLCAAGNATLLLIDAPCAPGTAGSRVVLDDGEATDGSAGEELFLGLVLPPLQRSDGLMMDLSFVLPWCRVLARIAPWIGSHPAAAAAPIRPFRNRQLRRRKLKETVADAMHATVLIYCESTWGTGAVVDARNGIVVTNAHILRGKGSRRFRARLVAQTDDDDHHHPQWYELRKLYVSDNFVDVAVLQLETRGRGLPLDWMLRPTLSDLDSTDDIVVLGYPSYPPLLTERPTVSYGKATPQRLQSSHRIADSANPTAIVLTSASVHPGSSGGPVVRVRDGALVGLLTSFTQCCDDDGKIIVAHPTLNFVVPASLLAPLWDFIAGGSRDVAILRRLRDISHLEDTIAPFWPSTDPPTPPPPPRLNAKL